MTEFANKLLRIVKEMGVAVPQTEAEGWQLCEKVAQRTVSRGAELMGGHPQYRRTPTGFAIYDKAGEEVVRLYVKDYWLPNN